MTISIDLQKLRYLLEVVDQGSFTRASLSLRVAQSALSRHVRELEQQFGQALCTRTGRGVVVTDFAEHILPQVRALVLQSDQLASDIAAARGEVIGTVRLAVLTSLSRLILTPLLTEITQRLPKVELCVREGLTDHIEEWVTAGRVDLALLYADHSSLRRDGELFMSSDLYLVGARATPALSQSSVPLKKAVGLPMILPAPPNRWRLTIEEACASRGVSLQVAHEFDSVETIKDILRASPRYSILPLHAIQDEVQAGTLKASRIVQPSITRDVILALTPRRSPNRATSEVAVMLRRQIREQLSSGRIMSMPSPARR
jgi:LysR family transcriptional regulator, nitrogen assimilation regulatory protein